MRSTGSFSDNVARLREELCSADAILIGAGAGMSTAAGISYSGERFMRYFADFHEKYGITDIYSGGFYPFETPEEYWAWWSRHIWYNRYDVPVGKPYTDLLALVEGRNYFVLTTNVDHQFQRAGFDRQRLFYTQGDYGLWQCSVPCHQQTYGNEEPVRRMIEAQQTGQKMRITTELIPRCPKCGAPMTTNLRSDDRFVEDAGWHAAAQRYEAFLAAHADKRILLMELGVGGNTPGIIKFPFLRMTLQNPRATYACLNYGEAFTLEEIAARSICIDGDIAQVLEML